MIASRAIRAIGSTIGERHRAGALLRKSSIGAGKESSTHRMSIRSALLIISGPPTSPEPRRRNDKFRCAGKRPGCVSDRRAGKRQCACRAWTASAVRRSFAYLTRTLIISPGSPFANIESPCSIDGWAVNQQHSRALLRSWQRMGVGQAATSSRSARTTCTSQGT